MAKQERARRTRERVLDAAAGEFASQGYAKTTLNQVATNTGMTKGALYGHFSAKDEVANELLDQAAETWRGMCRRHDVPGRPAADALEALILELGERLGTEVRLRAALRLGQDCPELLKPGQDLSTTVYEDCAGLVRRVQRQEGSVRLLPELAARLVTVVANGVVHVPGRTDVGPETVGWSQIWRLLLDLMSTETTRADT